MRSILRLVMVALATVFAAASASAADLTATVVEYGLYTADTQSEKLRPDGITDTVIENLCHYATTTTVPMKAGVHFGFRLRIDGLAANQVVVLAKLIAFPRTVSPPSAKPLSQIMRPMPVMAGTLSYIGYGLDYDWEMVPGRWVFTISQADRTLAEMAFDVTDGADAPVPSTQETTCFKVSSL